MSSGKHCEAASKLDFSITTFIQLITKFAYCITICSHYFIVYTTLKNHISRSPHCRPSLASPQLLTIAGMHSLPLRGAACRHPNAPSRASQHVVAAPAFPIYRHATSGTSLAPAHRLRTLPYSSPHPPPTPRSLSANEHLPKQRHMSAPLTPDTRTFRSHRPVLYSDAFLRRSLHHCELSALLVRSRGTESSPLGRVRACAEARVVESYTPANAQDALVE